MFNVIRRKMKINKDLIDKIWFTSDIHYWHKNITYGESIWDDKDVNCRRFDSTRDMSLHMVEQINKYVGENDILFDLGDWSFDGIQNIYNLRKQLKVKTIHHINGNHDHHIVNNKELPNCHNVFSGGWCDYFDSNISKANAHDLFESVNDYLEINIGKKLLILSHYPFQSWKDIGKGSIHLHGHTHGKINHLKNRLDVGLDSAYKLFGEYKPFSYKEILEILK